MLFISLFSKSTINVFVLEIKCWDVTTLAEDAKLAAVLANHALLLAVNNNEYPNFNLVMYEWCTSRNLETL